LFYRIASKFSRHSREFVKTVNIYVVKWLFRIRNGNLFICYSRNSVMTMFVILKFDCICLSKAISCTSHSGCATYLCAVEKTDKQFCESLFMWLVNPPTLQRPSSQSPSWGPKWQEIMICFDTFIDWTMQIKRDRMWVSYKELTKILININSTLFENSS